MISIRTEGHNQGQRAKDGREVSASWGDACQYSVFPGSYKLTIVTICLLGANHIAGAGRRRCTHAQIQCKLLGWVANALADTS